MVYVHGVNMAWLNYGSDFGGGSSGAAANQSIIDSWFTRAQAAGMNVVRWFLFPTDSANGPSQILRDVNNVPTGISPAVWTDIDAVLAMAASRNLALNFVIFNQPTNMPSAWRDDPTTRSALVSALGTIFSRYQNHPHIFAWESFNEADNYIYLPIDGTARIDRTNFLQLVTDINGQVHSQSPLTLATVSNGGCGGTVLTYFKNTGCDFYQAHWYDNSAPVRTDDYNMYLHSYDYYRMKWNLDKPLIVGEFYGDTSAGAESPGVTTSQKYATFYANGYAGGWGWSATPSAGDGMRIDWSAATSFAATAPDLGPRT